jgi:hypothetical protein
LDLKIVKKIKLFLHSSSHEEVELLVWEAYLEAILRPIANELL